MCCFCLNNPMEQCLRHAATTVHPYLVAKAAALIDIPSVTSTAVSHKTHWNQQIWWSICGWPWQLAPPFKMLRIVSISVPVIELLQAGSVSLFLGPADGLHSHSLLLDEEKGRLLLGTRDHVYLLDPDDLSRTPRKVPRCGAFKNKDRMTTQSFTARY